MSRLTLILSYYLNPGMLVEQYKLLRELPDHIKKELNLIIVDDGSPKNPAFLESTGIPTRLFRMLVDIRWNQDACRNLAVHHTETEWVLLTDIDHMVPERTFQKVLSYQLDAEKVYRFSRVSAPAMEWYKPHPNSWFMTKVIYEGKIGGYDERLAGYYGTDADFSKRVHDNAEVVFFKEPLIRVPREVISDASTTTYLRKQMMDKVGIPRIKAGRDGVKGWRPTTLSFPYELVGSC